MVNISNCCFEDRTHSSRDWMPLDELITFGFCQVNKLITISDCLRPEIDVWLHLKECHASFSATTSTVLNTCIRR